MALKLSNPLRRYWVHISYSHDLQKLGYHLQDCGQGAPFDAFDLTEEDWEAFQDIYRGSEPRLYKTLQNAIDNIAEK